MLGLLVTFAVVAGVTAGSAVLFVFGVGLRIHDAWYALVPFAIGSIVLFVLRARLPPTQQDDP